MKHIGKLLKEIVESNHVQKNKLASKVGITPTYLSRCFTMESIDIILLEKLCKELQISPLRFFDDEFSSHIHIGDVKAEGVNNVASVNVSQGELEALKKLLEEKERTIQILLKERAN